MSGDRILALDLANRTGWAYSPGDELRFHGVWDLSRKDDSHPGLRLRRLYDLLLEFLSREHWLNLIVYEDAHYGTKNHDIAALHAELRGVIRMWAASHEVPVLGIKPSTLKLFATGNGRATKAQMVRAAKTFFHMDVTDDEADALFLLEIGRQRARLPEIMKTKPKRKRRTKKKERRLF